MESSIQYRIIWICPFDKSEIKGATIYDSFEAATKAAEFSKERRYSPGHKYKIEVIESKRFFKNYGH